MPARLPGGAGRNRTPDKLPAGERVPLLHVRRGAREDRRRLRPGSWSASAASPSDGRTRLSETGFASGASPTRAPRAPPRTAAGLKPSTCGFASCGSAAPIASERAPTDVCRADAPDDRRPVGAQPQHHEVHPRGGSRTPRVRIGPVRARRGDLPRSHAARRTDAENPAPAHPRARVRGGRALAEPGVVRLRARQDDRLDDRSDPRCHPDLRGALRARARARAA